MNTKALRQKILDLAIHGKLVPQDPNDEPASVLLNRIRAEKERLIKEGKIKKPKKAKATCDKPPYPFEVPEGWVWCRLEDYVFSVTDGDHQAPPKAEMGVPFLVISNITGGNIDFSNTRYVSKEYYENIPIDRKAKYGDILFSVTGSYGIVVNVDTDQQFCFQRHIGLIKPVIVNEYLSFVLMSDYIKRLCDALATGTAQKTVGLDTLRSFYIPIAPLQEQKRIVAQIKQLLLIINTLEAGKDNILLWSKQAKSKILDLAIHGKLVPQDPNDEPAAELLKRINPKAEIICDNPPYGKLPKGWCETTFKGVFEDVSSKPFQILQSQINAKGKHPVISQSSNYIEGYSDENVVYECDSPIVIFGDHTRNVKYVDFDFIVGADGVKIMKPYIDAKFAYYMMVHAASHIVNKGYSRHFSQISKLSYNVPPLSEQHRIVTKIEELFAQLDKIEESL